MTLLVAGGLIVPSTPLGTGFRNATQVKMNGSDCVSTLGARWLSPASDPKVLEQVECPPAVHIAHLATSRDVPLDYWWSAGTAPLVVIQGLDDAAAPPGNGHALRSSGVNGCGSSIYPMPGTFCCWNSRKLWHGPSLSFVKDPSHDRHHLTPLRRFALFGESSDRAASRACLGIRRASRRHAETRI